MNFNEPKLNISLTQIQEAEEDLDPKKNLKNIAASAAEILAESQLSTKWDDVIKMLDSEDISERLRLASHIIFRAKILLDEIERNPMSKTVVYNTMLMMDALEVSNLKGYIQNDTHLEFKNINSETISLESALKKENTRPFKVPENITMMVVDSKTGKKVSFASKKTLIESFKSDKDLEKTNISKKINNRFNNNNILRFY